MVLVGQKKAIAIAVRNVSGRRRWSKLAEWMRSGRLRDYMSSNAIARSAPVARFVCKFCGVGVPIDHLKIWQAPISQQFRPQRVRMIAPHLKQRNTVVNLGGLPQTSAGLAAAPRLPGPWDPSVVTRSSPESPCDHRGAVPVALGQRSIGRHASRSDKPVARIHGKILDLSRMPVPGRALVGFGM